MAQSVAHGEELPWDGAGISSSQGDWESSGNISWKRLWIHFEGSGSGMGNVLNQRHSRALPAHTLSSWDIYFPKSPSWMARLEGCKGLVGKKIAQVVAKFSVSSPRFRKGEVCT